LREDQLRVFGRLFGEEFDAAYRLARCLSWPEHEMTVKLVC
jgi:hypothetical protein